MTGGKYLRQSDATPSPGKGVDLGVSPRALSIARVIDRLMKSPGHYMIRLVVPEHKRSPWLVEFHSLEPLQRLELGK
jgi:hypothetical protein